MFVKRTAADTVEVSGYGQAGQGELIEVPEHSGKLLIAGGGWEKASKPASKKAAKPAAEE